MRVNAEIQSANLIKTINTGLLLLAMSGMSIKAYAMNKPNQQLF